MASSRKSRPTLDPVEQQLLDAVRAALARASGAPTPTIAEGDLITAAAPRRKAARAQSILVGISGGRDSIALLDVICRLRDTREPGALHPLAVHVHHGLLPQADSWADWCRQRCEERGVAFELRRVTVPRGGAGLEANARAARYAAFLEMAQAHAARAVLTAHHLDDRIETFLLQWSRGAGVDGLAAFNAARELSEGVLLLRPFADIERSVIDRYVELRQLQFIDDPSNADTRLARNAVRANVVPALVAIRPGFRRAAGRAIDLVAEAVQILDSVAVAGLRRCAADAPKGALRLDRLHALPAAEQTLVLRRWLAQFGIESPSRARLFDLLAQALHARRDARLLVRLGAIEVRRHRGLLLARAAQRVPLRPDIVAVHWQGEDRIDVPSWGGSLRFGRAAEGFDADWLRAAPLQLRARTGGERFKPHATRPSKTLKRLFQDASIAEFERAALPLVWRADRLIFVPRLGPDARLVESDSTAARIALDWEPDATLATLLGDPQD
jgi:tRNA(Ile)-lysidine synthase